MTKIEQRKFTRVAVATEVTITTDCGVIVSNRLRDISLGGASMDVQELLPIGASCSLNFDLVGPATLLRLSVEGEVLRSDGERIAVKFSKIDLDSLIHLRHFIKVHTQDPELIEKEYISNMLEIEKITENDAQ
jgi:hypothetical protein